jgi:hypothetical protein
MAYSVYDVIDSLPKREYPRLIHEDLPYGGHINNWITSDGQSYKDHRVAEIAQDAIDLRKAIDDILK